MREAVSASLFLNPMEKIENCLIHPQMQRKLFQFESGVFIWYIQNKKALQRRPKIIN